MKKTAVILLALVMLLSFTACKSEEDKMQLELYNKYADYIQRLENKDWMGLVNELTGVIIREQQGDDYKERVPMVKVISDKWYLNVPYGETAKYAETIEVREDGTCTIDGKTMNWVELNSGENSISVVLMDAGVATYTLSCRFDQEDDMAPYLNLCEVETHGEGENTWMGTGDQLAQYYNHPLMGILFDNWDILDSSDTTEIQYLYVYRNYVSFQDKYFNWTVVDPESTENISLALVNREDENEKYTLTMNFVEEYPIVTLADAAGETISRYYEYDRGYNPAWPERVYPRLLRHLESYLNGYSFQPEGYENYIQNHEAGAYLLQAFTDLGDYKDSAEIASRFTVLKDMFTRVNVLRADNLGNTREDYTQSYTYDNQGRLIRSYGDADNSRYYGIDGTLQLFYGANDRVEKLQYGDITAIITPTYDDAGRMVSARAQYNSYANVMTYTYDDQGRIAAIHRDREGDTNKHYVYDYVYTYGDDGKLLQIVKTYYSGYDYTDVTSYVYDAKGYLVEESTKYTRVNWNGQEEYIKTETISYSNDANGRPLTATFTTDEKNYSYAKVEYTYVYQDLYYYNQEG